MPGNFFMSDNPYEAPQAELQGIPNVAESDKASSFVWLGLIALQIALYANATKLRRKVFHFLGLSLLAFRLLSAFEV